MAKTENSTQATDGARLWLVLARAYGAMARYVEHSIAAKGYCLSDFMVLEVLLHKGPLPISAIGERVLLASASMTAAVDRLTKRRMVVRQSSETDGRSRVIALTREGRAFIEDLYARHVLDLEAVTSSLSEKERGKLRSMLKTVGLAAEAEDQRRSKEAGTATPGKNIAKRAVAA